MKNYLALLILKIIAYFPIGTSRGLGKFLGRFLYSSNSRSAQICKKNLTLCYPALNAKEIDRLCFDRMQHLGQSLFETPKIWRKGSMWIEPKIKTVHGLDIFESLFEQKKGLIIIIPHLGNWEILGLWISKRVPMTSIYEPPKIKSLNDWVKRGRENAGANLVPADISGVSNVLKALTKGEVTGILPDQFPPEISGHISTFFNVKTRTMTLIHKLIGRVNCNALIASAIRVAGGWEIYFQRVDDDINSTEISVSLNALNQSIQTMINLNPSQYQWEYKRFKDLKNNGKKFYD